MGAFLTLVGNALTSKMGTQILLAAGEWAMKELRKREDNPIETGDVERVAKARAEYLAKKKLGG